MSDRLSVDEAFPLPTADEAFPQARPAWDLSGPFFDEQFSVESAGKILDYFGAGVRQGWGQRPLGDFAEKSWVKEARNLGLFNDLDKHERNWVKQFNESLLRGTAVALDAAMMRLPTAGYYGLTKPYVETGLLPRDIAAIPEAFPEFGKSMGLERPRPSMRMLEDARRLGVIGEGTAEEARQAFVPQGVERATERVVERPVEPVAEPTPARPEDVHQLARYIAPETFSKYDALAEQREALTQWIDEQRVERDAPAQARIDEILGKVNNVEERLTRRAALRLELARKELEEIQSVDTPAMAAARKARQEIDFQMRDMAEEVSGAYREAYRQMPQEALEETVAPVREPVQIQPESAATPTANIIELSQRRPTIARDVEQQLLEVGRTAEEARAAAALVQAHYEARAARFEGALGRARDLYEAEAPRIVVAGGNQRGALNLAQNTIKLFRSADASTFVHETGHSWLEELRRDAEHPLAPEGVKADLQTVKDWLGAGDTFTRAQHEKFARGFERYLMEGQAPSSKLAQVFEKFKNWLTQIYQTVSRLRAPITDDIRGVYDRLISTPSKEPVITPERPGAVDFATHAEETARATPAAEATQAADNILAERERVSQLVSRVVDDARREARRGPQRVSVPLREGAGGEPTAVRPGPAEANAAINTGRNPPTGKSAAPRSAAEPFDKIDGDLVDKAGNIRIDNLNVPDDVVAAIRQAAKEGGGFVEARRGRLSDIEVKELADAFGMSPNRLDRRRIGEAFNAEEIVQARRLLVRSATEVRDAMARAATGDEKGIIEYAIARERHLMIQEQVAGITAEAGRALRAFRQIEGMEDAVALTQFFQQRIKKTPEALQREAQMGLRLNDPAQITKYVREQAAPGWQHMAVEAWMSSLLSGPMTHLRNIIGNATVSLNTVAETGLAAGVSRVLRHEHGVAFEEVGDQFFGLGQGSIDGVRAFAKAMTDETYALEKEARQQDVAFRRAIPDVNVAGYNIPLGQAIRMPLRLLAAEDEFFKALAFRQQLNVLARRSARLEGLEGEALNARMAELLLDPTEEMLKGATQFAEYQTFTNPLGPKGRALQQWADSHPWARFIMPFIRTPTNIIKYAGERTPFGLASQKVRDNLFGRNGEAAQATQIARLAMGTMVMTAAGVLAFNDLLTGGGSPRPEVRNNDVQAGKLPYAARIGNSWVSFQGIDPVSFPLAIAADLAELAKNVSKDDPDYQKAAAMAVVNLAGHGVVERLPIRTLATMIQAIFDPEQHGQQLINQTAGTLVPGAIGQMAQIEDPVQRDTRALVDALKARVGLREGLMPRRDVWGEPVAQTDVGPVRVSGAPTDPVRLEVARLGMGMGTAQRKWDGVELTPQQYDDYVRISGRFAKTQLDSLIEQPFYQGLPDGVKRQVIHRTIEGARKMAAAQVKMESVGTDHDLVQLGIQEKLKVLK